MFRGTPNTSGRPKGSANKATSKVRVAFTQLVENNIEKMQKDLDSLEPKDRLKLILDLASFIIPKLKNVEWREEIKHEGLKFTQEERAKKILELAKKMKMGVNSKN